MKVEMKKYPWSYPACRRNSSGCPARTQASSSRSGRSCVAKELVFHPLVHQQMRHARAAFDQPHGIVPRP
jgi:hypothetical protein